MIIDITKYAIIAITNSSHNLAIKGLASGVVDSENKVFFYFSIALVKTPLNYGIMPSINESKYSTWC